MGIGTTLLLTREFQGSFKRLQKHGGFVLVRWFTESKAYYRTIGVTSDFYMHGGSTNIG